MAPIGQPGTSHRPALQLQDDDVDDGDDDFEGDEDEDDEDDDEDADEPETWQVFHVPSLIHELN